MSFPTGENKALGLARLDDQADSAKLQADFPLLEALQPEPLDRDQKPAVTTLRTRSRHSRVVMLCALLLVAVATPMWSVEFSYQDGAGEVIYRFTPETGTLSDLEVVHRGDAGEVAFFPAFQGGITQFFLGGQKVETADGLHSVTLLKENESEQSYRAKFRWRFANERFDFFVEMRLEGKTLVMDFRSDSDAVILFDLVRSENTPDPKIIDLPYGHKVLFSSGLFTSALIDLRKSDASEIWPTKHYESPTSASFGRWGFYRTLSNGDRNSLRETVRLTTSAQIEDTFFRPQNPVSPYRDMLSDYVVVDMWRRSFADYLSDLGQVVARGFENIFAIVHVWQRFGYDNGFPTTTPPASSMGGKAGLKEVARLARTNGYLFGLHTNYVDFYPNSKSWTPRNLALNSKGEPIPAWNSRLGGQSFLMKPSKARHYARRVEPSIHKKYLTSAAYLDVHSAILPSMKVDLDARVKNPGRQLSTFEHYTDLISNVRSWHQGPVAGEGKGGSSGIWAGYIDAIEADPRSLQHEIEGTRGGKTPAIVDYKLRVLHSLFVPHGVGYFSRFYKRSSEYTAEQFSRYLATEIAFGNAGFLGRAYFEPFNERELQRKYDFMTLLQPEYLRSEVTQIDYRLGAEWLPLSSALRAVLPTISRRRVDRKLSERLGILRVRYASTFEVIVNRSVSRSIDVAAAGSTYRLEPSDFLALKCGQAIAYSARINAIDAEFVADSAGTC